MFRPHRKPAPKRFVRSGPIRFGLAGRNLPTLVRGARQAGAPITAIYRTKADGIWSVQWKKWHA